MFGTSPIIILGAQACGEGSSPPRMLSLPQLSIRLAPGTYDNQIQHLTYGTRTDMVRFGSWYGIRQDAIWIQCPISRYGWSWVIPVGTTEIGEFQQNWQNSHHSRSGKKRGKKKKKWRRRNKKGECIGYWRSLLLVVIARICFSPQLVVAVASLSFLVSVCVPSFFLSSLSSSWFDRVKRDERVKKPLLPS